MKHLARVTIVLLPLIGLTSLTAAAASPFDGTWVMDPTTQTAEGKPDSYLLKDGKYTCDTCAAGLTVAADGKMHKVNGHDFYDEAQVTIVNPMSVKVVGTLHGKPSLERTQTVSADGKTMTEEVLIYQGGTRQTATNKYKRLKDGPPGAHAISGTWKNDVANGTMSPELMTATVLETADGVKVSYPTHQGYDAKFDGKEYPVSNDPTGTMVVLEKLGPRKLRETDKRHGEVQSVMTFEVTADGKSVHIVDEERLAGQTYTWISRKQ